MFAASTARCAQEAIQPTQHYQALHSALRAPFAQQCFRSATQQPASAFSFVCTSPHCRTVRRQNNSSSPHSRPAEPLAVACIRSQMKLSTCHAPHSSPGGLRLCSSAFARSGTATGCIRSRLPSVQKGCIRIQLHFPLFTDRSLQAVRIRARL